MNNLRKTYAVIVAAGKGKRVGGGVPKQLLPYAGSTVLGTCIDCFMQHDRIDRIIVVAPEDGSCDERYMEIAKESAARYNRDERIEIVHGGQERSQSVQNGLALCRQLAKQDGFEANELDQIAVLIHDAARPGISSQIIDRNLEALTGCKATVTCVPAVDSVRIVDEAQEQLRLNIDSNYHIMKSNVIERQNVLNVQTPQSFVLSDILKAYDKAREDGYVGTDDASIASHAGIEPAIVMGTYSNRKITTIEDLPMNIRVGSGFDVHKLVPERRLVLCGTPVPNEKGLLGHSDADVATHALMDALLGAAGKGDIGKLFPDNDDTYKDADSLRLLAQVRELLAEYNILNVDITIICQSPRLAPYSQEMRENIARVLGIDTQSVNVKATTTEGLGFTGQSEGIAAIATCSIEGRL